ncbi:fumarylacetoacetate hydrolase family protein [uncultured Amnibacterium sp.]|uniref:fumarylacetoacetate hydrolase family protein n=1 Tax=uncultured Amnibacterium sp. TaxID=1631851 RepID=UPI0035CB6084
MPAASEGDPAVALVRFRVAPDAPAEAGVLLNGVVHRLDLAGLGTTSINDVIERWAQLGPLLQDLRGRPGLAVEDVTLAAPVEPRQVLQTGANYREHVVDLAVSHRPADDPRTEAEARADAGRLIDERAASGDPYLFIALPQTVVGPDVPLAIPRSSDRTDWELELAVIIGRRAFRVGRAEALEHVWGYTVANDVTRRDLVFRRDMPAIGSDWFRAKNAPGFTPTGPFAVPAEATRSPFALRLDVDGETMQDASTDDLLFDVPALVEAASQTIPLLPGDVLLTGSPAGNGQARGIFLRPGSTMVGSISGLGTQRVRCVAEGRSAHPEESSTAT